MIEREKQRDDQHKKQAEKKQRRAHPGRDEKKGTAQKQAGKDTDPETMKDKGYIKRIEEKTEKH